MLTIPWFGALLMVIGANSQNGSDDVFWLAFLKLLLHVSAVSGFAAIVCGVIGNRKGPLKRNLGIILGGIVMAIILYFEI